MLSTSSSLLTSPTTISVVVPSRVSLAVACSSASLRPDRIKTSGRSSPAVGKVFDKPMAHARPIPPDAPVMRMTRGVDMVNRVCWRDIDTWAEGET
jgi:hypothetical protein